MNILKYFTIPTLVIFFALMFISVDGHAQKRNKAPGWKYEIEAVAIGSQGTSLIKVWSYSKRPKVAIEQAKKNAVHGTIFRGYAGIPGVPTQKPLASDPNLEFNQADFFNNFFADGGKYMKFVNISSDGSIDPRDRLKVGKEYKIGVVVSVNVSMLRQDLEAAGIIKSLSHGF